MKASIIIPFYNGADTLRWTIESAVRQRYDNFEVILVDDGSTDVNVSHSASIYAAAYKRILLIRTANHGVASARNTGAKAAVGDALLFLDGDDWIDKDFLQLTSAVLNDEPSVGIVSTDMHVFTEASDSVVVAAPATLAVEKSTNVIPNTSLIRRAAFDQTGGYQQSVYEDWNLWLDILEKGWEHEVVNEPLLHYRGHTASDSRITKLGREHETLMENMKRMHPKLYDNG